MVTSWSAVDKRQRRQVRDVVDLTAELAGEP